MLTLADVGPCPHGVLECHWHDSIGAANNYVAEHARHDDAEILAAAELLTFKYIMEPDAGEKRRKEIAVGFLLGFDLGFAKLGGEP